MRERWTGEGGLLWRWEMNTGRIFWNVRAVTRYGHIVGASRNLSLGRAVFEVALLAAQRMEEEPSPVSQATPDNERERAG